MSYNFGRQTRKSALVRSLLVAAIVLAYTFGTASSAAAQKVTSPTTPAKITPPAGNSAYLVGHALGTQGYVCLPKGTGASWTVNGARPEATLFESLAGLDRQITTHFLSPNASPNQNAPNPLPFGNVTWQSSIDSSKVWAKPIESIAAGSDPSCPNTGAIACLLLVSIGSQAGPTGGKLLTKTTFIQRLNTKGGSAPVMPAAPPPPMWAINFWCRTRPTTTSSVGPNSTSPDWGDRLIGGPYVQHEDTTRTRHQRGRHSG